MSDAPTDREITERANELADYAFKATGVAQPYELLRFLAERELRRERGLPSLADQVRT